MLRQPDVDAIFSAIAPPIRRAMLEQLASGESMVSEPAAPHDVTQPAASHHVRVLQGAGLLARKKDGRLRICAIEAATLSAAFSWLLRHHIFWEDVLDDVQRRAEQTDDNPSDVTGSR